MTKDENATKPSRGRNRGQNKERVKPPTKVVIRHLPPTMTEEEFLKHFDPLPKHDFYYFAAADWSLGYGATCRAYITLKNYDDVFMLRDQFDGYVFVDSKGAEYAAIVEFAPFQGLAKNKSRRSDNKVNTIEEDPHYQNFLKKLEEDREAAAKGGESKLEFSLDRKKEEITSTPLLQYLANKKEKRREEKRRQREEEKERRQQQMKIYSSGQDNASGKTKNNSKDKNANANKSQQGAEHQDEVKTVRSKRRLERSQRRREQYELRKKEREQQRELEKEKAPERIEKDNTNDQPAEKTDKDTEPDNQKTVTAESSNATNELPMPANEDEKKRKPQDPKPRKEIKRYSEKRERKISNNDKAVVDAAAAASNRKSPISEKPQEIVNESVMNFIKNAASAKEFVPKHMQEDQDKILQQRHVEAEQNREAEKRIRNKDRPSIAIYQPKARLRVSEESDQDPQNSNPKASSSSTAITEPQKPEQKAKKVSRYSKRREKRLNKEEDEVFTIGHWLSLEEYDDR